MALSRRWTLLSVIVFALLLGSALVLFQDKSAVDKEGEVVSPARVAEIPDDVPVSAAVSAQDSVSPEKRPHRKGIYERYRKHTGRDVSAPRDPEEVVREREWQAKIVEALEVPGGEANIVEELFELLPDADKIGQASIVSHIANLVGDAERYGKLVDFLVEGNLGEEAMGLLFTDLVTRPEDISTPGLIAIAEREGHPFKEDALGVLTLRMDDQIPVGDQ